MSKKQTGEYDSTIEHLLTLIRASQPLIWVNTHEEDRFLLDLQFYIKKNIKKDWAIYIWSATSGIRIYDENTRGIVPPEKGTENLSKALQFISEYDTIKAKVAGVIFVMLDINPLFTPPVPRKLRDMYQEFAESRMIKSIVFCSPTVSHDGGRRSGIEPTLEKQIPLLTFGLPSSEVIRGYIEQSISELPSRIPVAVKNSYKIDYSIKEIDEIVNALQGLTIEEVQRATMTSLQHLKGFYPEHMLKTKRQIIDRGEILEYIEARPEWGDVGGLDAAKDYFSTYADQFSQKAKAYGVEPLRGVLLTGIPGCLSGDNIVRYNRGKRPGYREITIENMYNRFNKINRYSWNSKITTYLQSFDGNNKLIKNKVLRVDNSGIKEIFKLTVINNLGEQKELKLTEDHLVCTDDGIFVPARDLNIGEKVLIRGFMKPRYNGGKKQYLYPRRKVIETLKFHPIAPSHLVNSYTYQRSNYSRLVIEAYMNKIDTELFINILKTDQIKTKELKFLSKEYDVHHIDENPLNDRIENLIVLEHSEHSKHHSKTENFNIDYLQEATVQDFEYVGLEQTYDIEMEYPHCNFIANGIVVHNCGKSLIAKAVASTWKIPLLRLDIGKVMAGVVGASEEKMRQVIQQVEAVAPCLLWIDEIEKSLSGTKSSNNSDGGTLSRVFGTLLTAMEERMENVVTIATANDIQALPPELIRRFNEVFFVDLPTDQEREDILKIHLSKRGRDIEKLGINKDAFIKATVGFTGSEIEKAVKEAIAKAFVENKVDIDESCLLAAAEGTKPISQIMKEQIDTIRHWAENRARLASTPLVIKKEKKASTAALIVERGVEEETDFQKKLDKALGF